MDKYDVYCRKLFVKEMEKQTGYPVNSRTKDDGTFVYGVEQQYQKWLDDTAARQVKQNDCTNRR